jgi:hypothetical protein
MFCRVLFHSVCACNNCMGFEFLTSSQICFYSSYCGVVLQAMLLLSMKFIPTLSEDKNTCCTLAGFELLTMKLAIYVDGHLAIGSIYPMKHHTLKSVNNCLNANIYSYFETYGGQTSNIYLNVVHFFNTSVNYTSVAA